MGSEATPLMLTILEGEKLQDDDDEQQQNAASSFDDDDASFTRVHRRWQQSASSSTSKRGRGSLLLSFGSALLNFTNNNNNDDNKQQQQGQHQHRRSPTSSIFDFGSTIIRELSHDFVDYEKSESIALNALYSITQPVATAEDDGGHIMMMRHPTLLDPNELIAATVLIVEEELDYGDLRWSLLSNTFFIFGGFYECVSAIWDAIDAQHGHDEENTNNNNNNIWSIVRIAVGLLGPIVYCLNSIVDITWAIRFEQRHDRRQQLDDLNIYLIAPDKDVEVVERHDSKGGQTKSIRLRLPFEPHNVWRRLRRHIGHRRALSAAVAFGVGALLEFATSYLGDFSTTTISDEGLHVIDALSVNAYVASAIFALTEKGGDRRKLKPWTEVWYDAPRLESLGDIFFGIAMTVDFSICYLHLDAWGSFSFIWPLISALLWQFDALCYLRADVNSMTLYKANRPLGDTVASNDTSSTSSSSFS